MAKDEILDLETFHFRGLHPLVSMGTASDRYAGWMGQIYTAERYAAGQINRRSHTVGGKAFVEEVLPVVSVEEYFEHFRVLELDFTFYRFLLEEDGRPESIRARTMTLKHFRPNWRPNAAIWLQK